MNSALDQISDQVDELLYLRGYIKTKDANMTAQIRGPVATPTGQHGHIPVPVCNTHVWSTGAWECEQAIQLNNER